MRLNSEKQQQPSQVAWFCVFFGDAFWNADCMEILLTLAGEKKQNMHHVPPGKLTWTPKKKGFGRWCSFWKGSCSDSVFVFWNHFNSKARELPIRIHPPTNNKCNPMVGTCKEGLQEMCFFNIGRWLPVVFQMTFKEKSEETTKTQITANLKFSTSPNIKKYHRLTQQKQKIPQSMGRP